MNGTFLPYKPPSMPMITWRRAIRDFAIVAGCVAALAWALGCGTAMRCAPGYSFCGNRPYEGVAQDAVLCGYVCDGGFNFATAFIGLASIPVDLVMDTVLLPPDLIAGEYYGCKKQPAWNMLKNEL
jgi:hypothetical protein